MTVCHNCDCVSFCDMIMRDDEPATSRSSEIIIHIALGLERLKDANISTLVLLCSSCLM